MIDKMEDRVKHAFNKYEDVLIMWLKNVNDGHVILGILFKRWPLQLI
jgi:phage gp36-like protein